MGSFMKPDRDEAILVPSHFESDRGTPTDRGFSALDMRAQQSDSPFKPGWNCWRVEPVRRAAFLIDGHAYFAAFREAALAAEGRHISSSHAESRYCAPQRPYWCSFV